MGGRAGVAAGAVVAASLCIGVSQATAGWGAQHVVGIGSFQDMVVETNGTTSIAFSVSAADPTGLSVASVDRLGRVTRTAVGVGGFGTGSLAEGANGELLVAWASPAGGVRVRSRTAGSWGRPVRIGSATGYAVQVAASRSGRAVVIWQTAAGRLRAAWRARAGGVWRGPVTLGEGLPRGAGQVASVRLDRAGGAVVVWRVGRTQGRVFTRTLPARASGWAPARRLSPPRVFTADVRIATGSSGDVLVGWQAGKALWLAQGQSAEALGGARRVATGVLAPPMLGVGPRGDAVVVWAGAGRSFVMSRTRRGPFSQARRALRGVDPFTSRGWNRSADIPVDQSGTATFAFQSSACPSAAYAAPVCVRTVRRDAGGRWTRPQVVLTIQSGGEIALPFLAAGPRGHISVAGSSSKEMSDVSTPLESLVQLTSFTP